MKGALLAAGVVPALLLGMLVLFDDPEPTPTSGGSGALNLEAVPAQYRDALSAAAGRCEAVTGPVLAAQIEAESNWSPTAVSPAGAQGIAQFMPGTWATWGRDYSGDGRADPFDPTDAIGSQADYMCHLSDWVAGQLAAGTITGDPLQLTLAAYNAGPGAVQRARGLPNITETRTYVDRILSLVPKYTATSTGDYDPAAWPAVSADGTYRVPKAGSGHLDPSTLCQIPWAPPGTSTRLRCDAEQALDRLDAAFHDKFGAHLAIVGAGAYRDYDTQVRLKAQQGRLAATPGTSNHGWGLAADITNLDVDGRQAWLAANAPAYGWDHPTWARPGGSKPEAWHWEYVGS